MYAYVDRPVASLAPDRLFLVRAMRVWVLAAHRGRCPCHTLAAWFADADMVDAMPHFRMMMAALHRDARERLVFGMPDRPAVTEDEAVLLALVAQHGEGRTSRDAVAALVKPDAAAILSRALSGVAAELAASPRLHPDPFPRDAGDPV